jgi:hypothetical protein
MIRVVAPCVCETDQHSSFLYLGQPGSLHVCGCGAGVGVWMRGSSYVFLFLSVSLQGVFGRRSLLCDWDSDRKALRVGDLHWPDGGGGGNCALPRDLGAPLLE